MNDDCSKNLDYNGKKTIVWVDAVFECSFIYTVKSKQSASQLANVSVFIISNVSP